MRMREFVSHLNKEAVEYREEPFRLRDKSLSHWYIDHRRGLARGDIMYAAGRFIVREAKRLDIPYQVVAGSGPAGNGLAISTAWRTSGRTESVLANLDKTDTEDPENGYGLHGGDVNGREILVVDDIGSSGSSLIELTNMVRYHGGHVEHAITISDRSQGRAEAALVKIGVAYHALLEFDEAKGKLVPIK